MGISRFLSYPIWAHGEYAEEYDPIRTLARSLKPGDVIQVNDRKCPLQVKETRPDGSIVLPTNDPLDDTIYRLTEYDGRKYGLRLHRANSKQGIDRMAVIYRFDGSISPYTEEDLVDLIEDSGTGPYELTWETDFTHAEPIDSDAPVEHNQRASVRFRMGDETVEENEDYQRTHSFETVTEHVDTLRLPHEHHFLPGTLFFRTVEVDADRHASRRVVPLDQIKSISPLPSS